MVLKVNIIQMGIKKVVVHNWKNSNYLLQLLLGDLRHFAMCMDVLC